MSTRGTFGVRIDGEDKLAYNHSDSYPSGLGLDILAEVAMMVDKWGIDLMVEKARNLKLVNDDYPPTAEDVAFLEKWTNTGVHNQSTSDWYCLLRELQGKLADTLTVGFMNESNSFIRDSLFCEWGYILNLDEMVLEVYTGFQTVPHEKGRYASLEGRQSYSGGDYYYPCALLVTFPLDNLPSENEFIVAINRAPFATEEEMVLYYLDEMGELDVETAAKQYGIEHLGEVIESLEAKGHDIDFDGETYELGQPVASMH